MQPKLSASFELAEILFQHVFHYFGPPEDVVSECGPQFTSQVWSSFLEKLGVMVSLTSGYHLQSNVQVEWVNQEVGQLLQTFCAENQTGWARFIPWAKYV